MRLVTETGRLVDQLMSLFLSEKTRSYLLGVDRFQRYMPIVAKIPRTKTVLDVGGGGGEIIKFLGREDITVLDPGFNEGLHGFRSYKVCGDGSSLPFKNNSFEIVLSVASLEHIAPGKRESYVNELKRVAKEKVLVYTPFGGLGEVYDLRIYSFRKRLGIHDQWTYEHIQNGLPSLEDLKRWFSGAKIGFIQNAKVWYAIMVLQTIPVFNRILPGLCYSLFLKHFDNRGEKIGSVIEWVKG